MTRGFPAFNFGANDKVSLDQTLYMEFLSNISPMSPDIPKATSHSGVLQTVYATADLVRFYNNKVSMILPLDLFPISFWLCPGKRVVKS